MAPLPARMRKVVGQSRGQETTHSGSSPGFAGSVLDAWSKSPKITGVSLSSACKLTASGKCCMQISRAIESCVLSHSLLFF